MKKFFASILVAIIIAFAFGFYKERHELLVKTYQYTKQSFTLYKADELLAGDAIQATLHVYEDNLGIVTIAFNTFGEVRSGIYEFRIKEKNSPNWYYENEYEAKQFGGLIFFPFGFPPIVNSKDKEYVIELESLQAQEGQGVALREEDPLIQTKHKFAKAELLADKKLLLHLFVTKIIEVVSKRDVQWIFLATFSIFIFCLLIWDSRAKLVKTLTKKKGGAKTKKTVQGIVLILHPIILGLEFIGRIVLSLAKLIVYFYKWLLKD